MRAVLQRVIRARVEVRERTVGEIGKGVLILLGVGEGDSKKDCDYLAEKIVLEEKPEFAFDTRELVGEVKIIKYTPNRIEIQAVSSKPALLFLSDNDYPGWQASVDNQETKIYRANYSFRALALPEGEHRVVFSYEPQVFFWGLRVSLLTLILFIVWLIFFKNK